jgi:hypothetical protein
METLGKTLIIGWDSRWVFKPVASLLSVGGNLCSYASMLDEIASLILGAIVVFLMVKGVVYQYRYITIPEIRKYGIR